VCLIPATAKPKSLFTILATAVDLSLS
jgi:hypothetical protein